MCIRDRFWRRRYGADPSLVGRSMVIAGQPRTVIGIVPDRFHVVPATISNAGSEPPQLWMLFNAPIGGGPAMRRAHFLYAIGRLKACLLYTSDAADERSSVDLGG